MFVDLLSLLVKLASPIMSFGLASFALWKSPRSKINRSFAACLSILGFHQVMLLVSDLVSDPDWRLQFLRIAYVTVMMISPSWFAFSLLFGSHNGGSRLGPWKLALIALVLPIPISCAAVASGFVVQPLRTASTGMVLFGLDTPGKLLMSVYIIGVTLVLFQFENLYRHAEHTTRWKIKFLVVGVFVGFSCQIVAVSYSLLYGVIHPLHTLFTSLAFFVGQILIAFSLVRHRLLDIDVFVSRYVVYRSLTIALIGGYLLSIGLAAELVTWFGLPLDLLSSAFLAILGGAGVSTLLLSERVRRSTQTLIQKHFYRNKYDYRREWMEFTQRLSRATTLPEIAANTVKRITEIMWVRQTALYIVGDSEDRLTLCHQAGFEDLPADVQLPDTIRHALLAYSQTCLSVAEQEESTEAASAVLRNILESKQTGCVVPVAALGRLVGVLVVGPELSGKPFGREDRDLLSAVAAQTGAQIVNTRLSQEASESRELQVLARLSAFVAHDLKNAVSMLSMLADNAKQHMDKPDFQADAIRTISNVADKMRSLMMTLKSPGQLAQRQVQRISVAPAVEAWLREIVSQVPQRIRVESRLGWVPEVELDPEQLRVVLQNLILNAVEATPGDGSILIETSQQNGEAVLAISDTGRGMSPEFIQKKLFRPFHTTKARGLGIGLYQCRTIIQAFGGTITAESEEGRGTKMIVRLPAAVACDQATEVREFERSSVRVFHEKDSSVENKTSR